MSNFHFGNVFCASIFTTQNFALLQIKHNAALFGFQPRER